MTVSKNTPIKVTILVFLSRNIKKKLHRNQVCCPSSRFGLYVTKPNFVQTWSEGLLPLYPFTTWTRQALDYDNYWQCDRLYSTYNSKPNLYRINIPIVNETKICSARAIIQKAVCDFTRRFKNRLFYISIMLVEIKVSFVRNIKLLLQIF